MAKFMEVSEVKGPVAVLRLVNVDLIERIGPVPDDEGRTVLCFSGWDRNKGREEITSETPGVMIVLGAYEDVKRSPALAHSWTGAVNVFEIDPDWLRVRQGK